ncbi:hypothetical protein B4096_0863 [Heyndrickxia coagulans]|nr:hypothetical protein B4100_3897 [Heyndrickxia coagulans]KYC77223.1 hypothetical protein B4096_0863 [Heyndrickxia coagulans]
MKTDIKNISFFMNSSLLMRGLKNIKCSNFCVAEQENFYYN